MSDTKPEDCCHGPGYATPLAAMTLGPREQLLYTICVQPNLDEPHGDYLATIDVDPDSTTYSQVIHRTFTNRKGNELHHFGWNTCSSCYHLPKGSSSPGSKRDKMILPALNSDFIYVLDIGKDERKPQLFKVIDGSVLKSHNMTAPHTAHCLPNGHIMVSIMGDAEGNARGDFVLFDADFNCLGKWTRGSRSAICGYDFWYQPYHDVMVSTEWGAPKKFRRGWKDEDMQDLTQYGCRLNFYKWSSRSLYQSIDLGADGFTPLEVRFMHDPKRPDGFVGCALFANVFYFKKKDDGSDEFECKKVIDIPDKMVASGGGAPTAMGGLISDILISLDDHFLYVNCWRHGDVRQYDIRDPEQPQLRAQIFLGGSICSDLTSIQVTEDKELQERPPPRYIKGRRLEGGPQMMQLSLDGRRLYVSSSLFSPWDKQFYPKMVEKGGHICRLDVDAATGGMQVNEDFLVDLQHEPYGPTLPHEMRYPGGDCTSDIWLAPDDQ